MANYDNPGPDAFDSIVENLFGTEATEEALADVLELAEILLANSPETEQRVIIAGVPTSRLDKSAAGYIYIQTEVSPDCVTTGVRLLNGDDIDDGAEVLNVTYINGALEYRQFGADEYPELTDALSDLANNADDPASKTLSGVVLEALSSNSLRHDTTNRLLEAILSYSSTHVGTETKVKEFIWSTEDHPPERQISGNIIQRAYTFPDVDSKLETELSVLTVKTLDVIIMDHTTNLMYRLSQEGDGSFELEKTVDSDRIDIATGREEDVRDEDDTNLDVEEEAHDELKRAGLLDPQQGDVDFIRQALSDYLLAILESDVQNLTQEPDND